MDLIGVVSSLRHVVASCLGNEIVVVNCGVLEVVVVSICRCRFLTPISIFNIDSFRPLPYLCFCIITCTAFQFKWVGWCFLVKAIAYFCSYWIWEHNRYMSCRSHWLLQFPILLLRCYSCCPKIGSKFKSIIMYVKSKVWLSKARGNDYSLKLGCDCTISFTSQGVVEAIKKRGGKNKLPKTLITKTWYLRKVYRRRPKIDNR